MKLNDLGLDELMQLAKKRGSVVMWEPPLTPFAEWGPIMTARGARENFRLVKP